MKAHLVTLLVIDFDKLGANAVKFELENQSYPNDCINPTIVSMLTRDIGEWTDEHPLNCQTWEYEGEIKRIFGDKDGTKHS
jgi:hypothetical protein